MLRALFISCVTIAAAARVLNADEPPQDLLVSNPGEKFRLVGKFHEPLGTVVIVQGVAINGPVKSHESGLNLRVQRINGRATQEDIRIRLTPYFNQFGEKARYGESLPAVLLGQSYEFEGYETGEFVGPPYKAYQRAGISFGTSYFYFSHRFSVYKAKGIKPIHWSPHDFVDRTALIEGLAVNHGDKRLISGDSWQLLVDSEPPWPRESLGKSVEGLGVVQKTAEPNQYRLQNAVTRLVRLEDQVGMPVVLRGRAWSMNGTWWLNYRGTKLYVDKITELPDWSSQMHGVKVQFSGVLEESMLPDLEQIAIESRPPLKKHYIIRKPTWQLVKELLAPELAEGQ